MNNKGFAISSILYMLILITGLLLASMLGVLTFRKNVLLSKINTISGELGGSLITQYRYLTADGEWSGWLNYAKKDDIDYSFTINKIPNLGTAGEAYDLTPTDVTLNIVDGEAYLSFNGTSSKAVSTTGMTVGANIMILEAESTNTATDEVIASFNTSVSEGVYYKDATGNLYITDSTGASQNASTSFYNNGVHKHVLFFNRTQGSYLAYTNGSATSLTGTTNIAKITSIGLGYFKQNNTGYLQGKIYRVLISSGLISSTEASDISDRTTSSDYEKIIDEGNADIKYGPFIEYREVTAKNKLTTNESFATRYIRDYMAGTTADTSNQILDIGVYAKFNSGEKFNGILIGGTYTGTYAKDKDYNNVTALGKIRVGGGVFTHINTKTYSLSDNMEVLTPFTTTSSYGSGLLVFIGSDITRFPSSAVSSFLGFVLADYSDRDDDGTNSWYYYNGTTWALFTPNKNDAIVGCVTKIAGESNLDVVKMFAPAFSYNVALGKTITSSYGTTDTNGHSISLIVNGDTSSANYFINGTGSQYVEIDLETEYNIAKVKLYHQYVTAPLTSLNTKTVLYNDSKNKSTTLWDYTTKGLYVEQTAGNGTTLYVDQNRMPNTFMTRYIMDYANGRYDASNNYTATDYWYEVQAYDLNGYNIALNKSIVSDTSATNLTYANDGNASTVCTIASGLHFVKIDLTKAYAIRDVNVMHSNVVNYTSLGTKTILITDDTGAGNIVYDSAIDGIYKEVSLGLRMKNMVIVTLGEGETVIPTSNFGYIATSQAYYVPLTGTYKLEVWGAQGGTGTYSSYTATGGKAGYAKGEINLTANETIYIYVGGQGTSGNSTAVYAGGYNGGGSGYQYSGGGGGATDIRRSGTALANRIIIAAGGGGGGTYSNYTGHGGYGGGSSGANTTNSGYSVAAGTYTSYGGSQSAGGTTTSGWNGAGGLGYGGNYYNQYIGGGGSGYYGGAAGAYYATGGAGGSSYIGSLTNGQTIAGNAAMPSPSGGTETGHTGNGYARITFIGGS